tara:strand:- start:337 stop:762 length:426 start_codon:yes stop_codon:yes gene_type:complete
MFLFKEKPKPTYSLAYLTPIALIPLWYFWGNWAYVSKATFMQGVSVIDTSIRSLTNKLNKLVGRVDDMDSNSMMKFGEIRRDLAHVETLLATLMKQSNVIEAEIKCTAQGVKVLCNTVSDVIENKNFSPEHALKELRCLKT